MILRIFILAILLMPINAPQPARARISVYKPWLGGINCAIFVEDRCISRTASGERWQDWTGDGLACPKQFPLWSRWSISSREWTCIDRGGWIVVQSDGIVRLDLLTEAHPFQGRIVDVSWQLGERRSRMANGNRELRELKNKYLRMLSREWTNAE